MPAGSTAAVIGRDEKSSKMPPKWPKRQKCAARNPLIGKAIDLHS
jgi:hypothetical protein